MESNFIKPRHNSYLEDYANGNFGYSGLGEIEDVWRIKEKENKDEYLTDV